MATMRLLSRGDDAGLCHTANSAIRDACEKGILRNVSMMAPAPVFEQAAELFRDLPGIDLGLHVDLTAEWANMQWGPVAPVEAVPSLVTGDGVFPHTCQDMDTQGVLLEHMQIEVTAQLDKARKLGLGITYLDEHMGVGWVVGLSTWLDDFCQREGLINNRKLLESGKLQRLPLPGAEDMDAAERMIAGLTVAGSGTYLIVGHPVYVTEEMDTFVLPGESPGTQTLQRDGQRRWFMDPAVVTWCREQDVQPIRYSDVA